MTTSKNDLVAGFDPGGKNSFGWCVAAIDPWRVVGRGVVSHANEACDGASEVLKAKNGNLVAAGIDAPLTWARDGGRRESDKHVEQWGTAMAVNSLRGACVVQGYLLAKALNKKHPRCLITETNPKPLLKYLKHNPDTEVANEFDAVSFKVGESEHIRDAIVSAWAAYKALNSQSNLYKNDTKIYRFLDKAVYWWPE